MIIHFDVNTKTNHYFDVFRFVLSLMKLVTIRLNIILVFSELIQTVILKRIYAYNMSNYPMHYPNIFFFITKCYMVHFQIGRNTFQV